MELSKTTIGVLATLCISAGAGGAYLATRSDQPAPASANADAAAVTPSSSTSAVAEPEAAPSESRLPMTPLALPAVPLPRQEHPSRRSRPSRRPACRQKSRPKLPGCPRPGTRTRRSCHHLR